jgi:hypothetical protein
MRIGQSQRKLGTAKKAVNEHFALHVDDIQQ